MTIFENAHTQGPLPPPDAHRPIYFAGGFGYDARRNSSVLAHIAELGYNTTPVLPDSRIHEADASFRVARSGSVARLSIREAMRIAHKADVEMSISNYQEARADELIGMLENSSYKKVDAIFQSADALNGLLAVHKRPDLFGNVVLAYPAGLVKQPRPAKASLGVFKSGLRGRLSKYRVPAEDSFEPLSSTLRSRPKTAGGFVTAASVALSSQSGLLSEVRQQPDTPGISLVLGLDDWMIQPERVLDGLNSARDVDYVLVTNTPHGIKGRKDVMSEVLKLFPLMERGNSASGPLVERMIFTKDISEDKRSALHTAAANVDTRTTRLL